MSQRRLSFRSPFDAEGLLSFLTSRAIVGVEEVVDGTYRRSVRTLGGPTIASMTPTSDHVALSADHDVGTLEPLARRAFDLDADPASIDGTLARDPALAPLVEQRPGLRVPGSFDGFELLIRAIVGQQVSVAGARTTLGRLTARFGTRLDAPDGGITHVFPTPAQVAAIPTEALPMPRARAATIRRVAELVDSGEVDLSGDVTARAALEKLGAVPGIGPWTLGYVAMRALRDGDAFLPTDLGVRRGAAALGIPSTPREMLEHAERWRPWRAYAVLHLWHG